MSLVTGSSVQASPFAGERAADNIVKLKAKGSAKSDRSGFVIRNPQALATTDTQFALAA